MIELLLDGKLAIPSSNANIKLTTENAYFTKSASYTYDIELPLDIAENREIFGWCQRMDIEKEPRTLEACLIVDNVTVLTGTAHITSIDNKAVKVQLLGEASSYNYGNKMENTYIDELDLGDWYMTTWPDGSYWSGLRPGVSGESHWSYYPEGTKFSGTSGSVFRRAAYNDAGENSDDIQTSNLLSGKYPWVAFPVNNSSADTICNGWSYMFTDTSWSAVRLYFRGYVGERSGERPAENPVVESGAIQPFIWIMAEKIAKATGFTLDREDNALYTNALFSKIFIVNTNTYIECNKCLPHWSVNEWWTQVENTFGVVLSIDYPTRKMRLDIRKDFYLSKAKTIHIEHVVDEYSSQVDDETNADISSNNVGFADFECDPGDLLSDFVRNNARVITEFANLGALQNWAKEQTSATLATYKDAIFEANSFHLIYKPNEGLVEVDMFRPRLANPDKESVDIELKFVPARFIDDQCDIYGVYDRHAGAAVNKQAPVGSFPVKILEAPGASDMTWYKHSTSSELDIAAIIDGEQDEPDATSDVPDVIYMAIAVQNSLYDYYRDAVLLTSGGSFADKVNYFKYPRAKLRQRTVIPAGENYKFEDYTFDLSLIPNDYKLNLARYTIVDSVRINARIRYCIKFLADRIPDTSSIFLIHNKRFVCEKIEADIKPSGLSKLMTGYFYEFDL